MIIEKAYSQGSILFHENPPNVPFPAPVSSYCFRDVTQLVTGLGFDRILIDFDSQILELIREFPASTKKVRVHPFDSLVWIGAILNGFGGKQREEPVDILLVVSLGVVGKEIPYLFLCRKA